MREYVKITSALVIGIFAGGCLPSAVFSQPAPGPDEQRECRQLQSGATFCREPNENGQMGKWLLQSDLPPGYAVGDEFPIYQYSMIMDLRRYGLEKVTGNWRYYKVDNVIYKVNPDTRTVMEIVKRAR